ncbi:transglycosylase domain-containing protein [Agilicoccus flavus]|uniref:transglycosylase domain-containing protein n=1 Tax=Agilicoccus flavus TaxID=2775968 RepID=UPI001CF6FAA4|nr:transglycosylase domain-containing protein [Agilicoccus flavus]
MSQSVVTAPPRRRRPRRALRIVLVTMLVLAVIGIGGFLTAYALISVPKPNELAQSQTSIVYYADGKNEIGRFSTVNRESVTLRSIPKDAQHAMLAAEDRDFYDNPGFSPTGIARAVWSAVSGGSRQGGSTITQQYVKNYFLSQDQTLGRKARELVISIKIEQEQSKDEILENYFNTIYYGRGAYGIQAASRAYFGKEVGKLTVGEGALLASVIRAPSLYDPSLGASQKKNAQDRVDYVLDGMVSQGWLSAAERKGITFPTVVEPKQRQTASGPNGYLMAYVKSELTSRLGLSEEDLDRGGLRVTTTISRAAQQAAINAVEKERPTGGKADGIRVGLASIVPGDGAIRALYGGANYAKQPYSSATQAQLQGGSTFKVFTTVAALQKNVSLRTRLDGSSPRYFDEFKGGGNADGKVSNFGNHDYGNLDVATALAKSSNTAFAQLNIDVGPAATRDAAIALGVPSTTPGLSDNPANVFGTASPRVIDMANAYATLAAKGKRAEPYLISKVTAVGGWLEPYAQQPVLADAVSPEVAADTLVAMEDVVQEGTATAARAVGRPAAGKTGTTDENRAVWFDGVTPQLATAVGMYLPTSDGGSEPMRGIAGLSEVTGGSYPVAIWTSFMRAALDGVPEEDFPERAGIGDGDVQDWAPEPTQEPEPSRTEESSQTPSEEPTPTTSGPTWSPTDRVEPAPSESDTGGEQDATPSQTNGRARAGESGRSRDSGDSGDANSDANGGAEQGAEQNEGGAQGAAPDRPAAQAPERRVGVPTPSP